MITMEKTKQTKKSLSKGTKIFIALGIIIIAFVTALLVYSNDYYKSEVSKDDYVAYSSFVIEEFSDGLFIDGGGNSDAVIFYPGGKVEYTAYLPLCTKLAAEGIDCFLVEMPFHLAVFGSNKAEGIMKEYTYDNWYLAGHSLGGAMAANYVVDNVDEFAGLIMLAAYPTKALISEDLKVLSIYGNKDEVLNREKLEAGSEFVPEHYTEIGLGGANHAGFGNYGIQKSDGEATMERDKQQDMTVKYIVKMINTTYE